MKRTNVQMMFSIGEDPSLIQAEIRTWNGKWTGDAVIRAASLGEHENSDDARQAIVKKLRELADVVERDA